MSVILSQAQAGFVREEKSFLTSLHSTLAGLDAPAHELETLKQALLQLDELFLIVVVGEFNAGKSALINALLGQRVLREGVTPTTYQVTLVKYGEAVHEGIGPDGLATVTFPLETLRELNIVDTPGTNAILRQHERLTRDFVPRSDLVLFVTSADRPFTESEREFLEQIRDWGKKTVLVINKRDLLETGSDLDQVRGFVSENVQRLLGFAPELLTVSAKQAQTGQVEESGIRELRDYILSWLEAGPRLRVKFSSPLGVASQILQRAHARALEEVEHFQTDIETAATLEREIGVYETELKQELRPRLAEVDNTLLRLEARGVDFFDTRFRLTNLAQLARGDRFRAEFEQQVLAGVPAEIEKRIQAAVNWLVDKDLRQWQKVSTYMHQRRLAVSHKLVGEVPTSIDPRRQALLDAVTQSAQGIVASYDAEKEAREVAASVEQSVLQVALVEAGAVGLGTAVTILVSSSVLDVTGVLFAGVMAVVGLFIIPFKREQAKVQFRLKIETLRRNLEKVLTAQFQSEADRTLERLREAVSPYLRFVKGETGRLETKLRTLRAQQDELTRMQEQLNLLLREPAD